LGGSAMIALAKHLIVATSVPNQHGLAYLVYLDTRPTLSKRDRAINFLSKSTLGNDWGDFRLC